MGHCNDTQKIVYKRVARGDESSVPDSAGSSQDAPAALFARPLFPALVSGQLNCSTSQAPVSGPIIAAISLIGQGIGALPAITAVFI
ncbi:hypothetical protein EIO60_00487|uniref:hypothetical protein n=1 Tax=Candidatus Pantoea persica TaxID=2518128 RepID=UPI0028680568|nr:hypothetical protein [Candidatus Pantoea persica]MBA2814385.1 hypothetical protein [Candidatus Pantoea persica]